MALFKINRGQAVNLPTNKHDGYAYFTTDDGKFYIDYENDQKTLQRQAINAEKADMDSLGNNINETYVMADIGEAEPGMDYTPDDVVNADTLGGHAVSEFVLKANAQTELGLDNFVTQESVNQIVDGKVSWLTGTTEEITPTQVYQALLKEQNVMITYEDSPYGQLTFTSFGAIGGLDSVVATEVFHVNGEMGQCQLVGNVTYNVWQFEMNPVSGDTQILTLTQEEFDALTEQDIKDLYESGVRTILVESGNGESSKIIINADTLGGKSASEYALRSAFAHNLLDNSDFTNPVNQRGQSTYSSSTYAIDRWYLYVTNGSNLIVNNGYITLTAHMYQKLTTIKANTVYTLAVKHLNGSLTIVSHVFPETGDGLSPINFYYTNGVATVRLGPGEYLWAALYEGEYTAETLPPYIPKGYVVELAECQRYYENSWFGGSKGNALQTTAMAWAANSCEGEFHFSTEKRTTPTMTAYPSGGRDAVSVYVQGYQPVSSTTWLMRSGLKGAWLRATMSSNVLTIGNAYGLHAHWEASADL